MRLRRVLTVAIGAAVFAGCVKHLHDLRQLPPTRVGTVRGDEGVTRIESRRSSGAPGRSSSGVPAAP